MRLLTAVVVMLVAPLVFSQGTMAALTLEAAQRLACTSSPAVALASERVQVARENQRLVEGDPYSVRVDLLRAAQGLEIAELGLGDARRAAVETVTGAYLTALVAQAKGEVANLEQRLTAIRASAARARFEAGAITRLDLEVAVRAESQAATAAAAAEGDLRSALEGLRDLLPAEVHGAELMLPVELPAVPELQPLLTAVDRTTAVSAAKHALALAVAQREALHPSIHSRVMISDAEAAVDEAELALGLALQQDVDRLLAAHAATIRASEVLARAREETRVARERLEVERARFQNGLAAEVEVLEAELAVARGTAAEVDATQLYSLALLPLDLMTWSAG